MLVSPQSSKKKFSPKIKKKFPKMSSIPRKLLIIFVCTSNTCRSPMAEQFGKHWLDTNGLSDQFKVISRGITEDYEPENSPASENGKIILQEDYNLDLEAHRSSILTIQEANEAYAIIGVTSSHKRYILQLFPSIDERKCQSLDVDVHDPWHQSIQVYRRCASILKPLVENKMEQLTSSSSSSSSSLS